MADEPLHLVHLVRCCLNDAPLASITQGPDDERTFLMAVGGGQRLTMHDGASLQLGAGPPQPVACAADVARVLEGWFPSRLSALYKDPRPYRMRRLLLLVAHALVLNAEKLYGLKVSRSADYQESGIEGCTQPSSVVRDNMARAADLCPSACFVVLDPSVTTEHLCLNWVGTGVGYWFEARCTAQCDPLINGRVLPNGTCAVAERALPLYAPANATSAAMFALPMRCSDTICGTLLFSRVENDFACRYEEGRAFVFYLWIGLVGFVCVVTAVSALFSEHPDLPPSFFLAILIAAACAFVWDFIICLAVAVCVCVGAGTALTQGVREMAKVRAADPAAVVLETKGPRTV